MSFWDRYLAPGDIRSQQPRTLPSSIPPSGANPDDLEKRIPRPTLEPRIDAAHRARRQNALLFGGVAFTFLSLFITRRSLRRRQPALSLTPNDPLPGKAAVPGDASKPAMTKLDGGFDAVEALGLATLNVCSVFMLAVGGFAKYFDIADVEDLREGVRKGVGYDVYGGDSEGDKEIEGWIAEVLSRKDVKEGGVGGIEGLKTAVAGKLSELVEEEKKQQEHAERSGLGKGR